MCRLAWQLLGMLGNVLGLLGMLRNVLGMLYNVLGMLATSSACFAQGPRSPTSKINPPTYCLISCEAKGVVYHQNSLAVYKDYKAKPLVRRSVHPRILHKSNYNFDIGQFPNRQSLSRMHQKLFTILVFQIIISFFLNVIVISLVCHGNNCFELYIQLLTW